MRNKTIMRDYARHTFTAQPSSRKIILDSLIGLAIGALLGTALAFFLLNWAGGCGERFPTADGGYVEGQCITPFNIMED